MAVELAGANEDDVPYLAALQAAARGGTVPEWAERIARLADGELSAVVLARVARALAGYANVTFLPEHPGDGAPPGYYLAGITVAPEWRRRGIATALTQWRMTWAWKRGPEAWCFVSAANRASLDLHHTLGFEEVRRGPSFQGVTYDCGEGVLLRARRPG